MKRSSNPRGETGVKDAPDVAAAANRVALPPALFLGRTRDLAAARAILRDGRVLVVWGLGGIGKTSLLRSLVGERDRPRTVEVRPSRGTGLRPIADSVARVWGAAAASAGDDEASALVLVALADARAATIVVEDAHWLDPGALRCLLTTFASFAQRGRLLMSSRARPDVPDLAERFLRLDALDAASVGALVRACRPDVSDEECARVVGLAGGSPWAARCMATGQARGAARVSDDLDEVATRALAAMRWIDTPLSEDAVDRIAGRPGTGRLLEARAFAERTGSRLRLHDVARDQLAEGGPADRAMAELALGHLAGDRQPHHACAALSLAAATGNTSVVEAIVEATGSNILATGLADAAYEALGALAPDVALGFRLECAARSGTRSALAWAVAQQPPAEPHAVVSWADCLMQCARGDEALASLAHAARTATGWTAHRAALLFARLARTEADANEALALLDLPHFAGSRPSSLHLAAEARALLQARRYEEATRRAERALDALEGLDPSDAAGFVLFCVFNNLGRYQEASRVLRVTPHLRDPLGLDRTQLYLTALHALDTGDLPSARTRLARFARLGEGHDAARFFLIYLRYRLAWVVGDVDGARAAEHALRAIATATGRSDYLTWARIATLHLAIDDGVDPPAANLPDAVRSTSSLEGIMLEVIERLARARRGAAVHFEDLQVPEEAVDYTAIHAQLEAECRARRGDLDGALRRLVDVRASAAAHGCFLAELEVMSVEARMRERAGQLETAKVLRADLDRRARRSGALRHAARTETSQRAESPVQGGGLSLDGERRIARLPDGRSVSLEQHELGFRILEEVSRQGGTATKEHLVRVVWERRTYVPSRDDKRLQMAVRRLRLLIEADPGSPVLFVTTRQGYALARTAAEPEAAPPAPRARRAQR